MASLSTTADASSITARESSTEVVCSATGISDYQRTDASQQ
jgi:hypothetical protein